MYKTEKGFSAAVRMLEKSLSDSRTCLIGERVKFPGHGANYEKWKRLELRAYRLLNQLQNLNDQADRLASAEREKSECQIRT